jgi:uncharacterized protein
MVADGPLLLKTETNLLNRSQGILRIQIRTLPKCVPRLPTTARLAKNGLIHFEFARGARSKLIVNFYLSHFHLHLAPCLLLGVSAFFLGGCTPTINLATPEPVKVDVAVRLDVYQKSAPTKAKEEQSSLEIAANRRTRSGEIQGLKNNGIVGEDRDGYLSMITKNTPTDPKYLAYAKGIIDAENADRSYLYLTNAQTQNKPLEMIEREYAQLWSDRAFPKEWVQKEDGTWTQK